MARLLTAATTAVATVAMAVGLNIPVAPATAAVPIMNWSGGSSFDDASSYFPAPVAVATGLKIVTAGYGHSHTEWVTLSVRLLPSSRTVWSVLVPPGGQVPMAIDIAFTPETNVTGINITSSPGQSQTYHDFTADDLVIALGNTPDVPGTPAPQCSDGMDNDLDGATDYSADSDCQSSDDPTEAPTTLPTVPPQCSDGIDNDLNGRADYPNDPGCTSSDDALEVSVNTNPGSCNVAGLPACIAVTPGALFREVVVPGAGTDVADTHEVYGSVDIYRFTLPTGGSALVPCVVTRVNAIEVDPCEMAGGTFASRVALLLDQEVDQPTAGLEGSLATVRICHATVTTTVAGIGIENFPAYTVC